jgi:hypothetical protein
MTEVCVMGIFDKLLQDGAKALSELATEENKEKAANFLNALKEGLEEVSDQIKERAKEANIDFDDLKSRSSGDVEYKEEYFEEDLEDTRSCREKILQVLADDFPKYEVKEDVSPLTIGGTGKCMNYSIGVYDGQEPKLFIMIIGKTTTSHREYRWSREEAEKKGYVFLNFVGHYPNRVEYIKERLAKYL